MKLFRKKQSFKEFKKLVDFCRANGVSRVTFNGITIELYDVNFGTNRVAGIADIANVVDNPSEQLNSSEVPDDVLYHSS